MPEIPEMEIYKNYLNQVVKGKRIARIVISRPKSVNLSVEEFTAKVLDREINTINRKGKFLTFALDNGDYLLTHMMLDGRLFHLPVGIAQSLDLNLEESEKLKEEVDGISAKPSVTFVLSDGSILFFCALTFGYLHYLNQAELEEVLGKLGPDPLDSNFKTEEFLKLIKGKRGMIKPWLMNQKNLAGVGNAYSNECLFEAGVLPTCVIPKLEENDKMKIFKSLTTVLQESIRLGGDMEEPFTPGDRFTGGFNQYFKVYDRAGEPCKVCGNPIIKEEVGGRNAFYCAYCQK